MVSLKFISCICLILLIACCALHRQESKVETKQSISSINCVKIQQLFPVNKMEGNRSVFMHHDTGYAYVYTYKNQMIIKSSYHFDSAFNEKLEPAHRELKYIALVFTKGSKYGSYTDEFREVYDDKINIDSVRADEWVSMLPLNYKIFSDDKVVKFYSANIIDGSDTLKEVYTYKDLSDTTVKGLFELYYINKTPGIAYSLSPELDSIKQRQLCKVFVTVAANAYGKNKVVQADGFTTMHEMRVIPVADKDTAAIMAIFRRDKWGQQ
jgi:hypothetical protein